ncbi:unnamed protein product [Cylindrotheca closterium]|uniref:Ubiquinone biosynthesis protein n=1 Tax=Cylindrotheca closterium TaxID=2856 RepID=A0AAD2CLQ8_9STRA|nr:unnamed protein product [Cylindrotheca closterium]
MLRTRSSTYKSSSPSSTVIIHDRFFATIADTAASDAAAAAPEKMSGMSDQKRRLAQAALQQIPKYGWTQDALTSAVMEDPQMSVSMTGLWTPIELVNWLMDDWNSQLQEKQIHDSQRMSAFDAIQWRLQQVIPLVKASRWHEGMALGLSTPVTTRSQLHDFVELAAPKDATMAYKTGLGSIFLSTELFMLTDSSEDFEATWEFLRNRLTELDNGKMVHFVDMNQIMSTISTGAGNLSSSGSGTNVPIAAASAIASSLLEGAASLLRPPTRSSTSHRSGTKASDYKPK